MTAKKNLILLICLIGGVFLCAREPTRTIPPDVNFIFIPGFLTEKRNFDEELQMCADTLPSPKFCGEVWYWKSNQSWWCAMRESDSEAKILAELLAQLPQKQRENMILCGHSLGGRIVIRTMVILEKKYHQKIRKGVFLGAAIANDDPDIAVALHASRSVNINVYCHNDFMLEHLFRLFGDGNKKALGAFPYKDKNIVNIHRVSKSSEGKPHYVGYYLLELQRVMQIK